MKKNIHYANGRKQNRKRTDGLDAGNPGTTGGRAPGTGRFLATGDFASDACVKDPSLVMQSSVLT
jgi:hypothetical protein